MFVFISISAEVHIRLDKRPFEVSCTKGSLWVKKVENHFSKRCYLKLIFGIFYFPNSLNKSDLSLLVLKLSRESSSVFAFFFMCYDYCPRTSCPITTGMFFNVRLSWRSQFWWCWSEGQAVVSLWLVFFWLAFMLKGQGSWDKASQTPWIF